ncbi:MAG: right-handed parallel beta-helix repeat-containing protein [archaeon]|nr:right-handed parallel beta-helix repeat-containing protein [archaeon]
MEKIVNKKVLSIFAVAMFLMSMVVIAVPVKAQITIVVPDDYLTIQEAVNHASDGDTIYVRAGTYSESVSVVGFTSLTIMAEGAGLPTKSVLVNPTPTGSIFGFYVISDGVTIEGFEIADTNFGIWFEGSYNKFSNNYIHDIYSTVYWWDGGVGISLWDMDGGSDYNSITNNVIEDIERTGILLDIAWTSGGTGINTGNSIVNNEISGTPWGAIEVLNAEDTTINGNIISDCGDWGIALLSVGTGIETSDNTIAHNVIQGSTSEWWGVGILVYAFYEGAAENNNIHHNCISDIGGISVGIWILANYNVIHHNSVDDTTNPYWDWGTGNRDFKNSWN